MNNYGSHKGRPCGEASGPLSGTHSSTGGSPTPVLRPSHRAWSEEHSKKRKRHVKEYLAGQGSTALNKEAKEHLAKQDEENLQAGLALSHEEARRSGLFVTLLEASMDPIYLGSVPPPIPVMNIGIDTTKPTPVYEPETSEALGQKGIEADAVNTQGPLPEHDANLGEVGVPVHHGVLGSTFGEASSCPSDEHLFH
ncbi:hypothetical protein ACLOJK_028250 [Asimina triloba]